MAWLTWSVTFLHHWLASRIWGLRLSAGGPPALAPGPKAAATPGDAAVLPAARERQRPAPAGVPAGAPTRATAAAPAATGVAQAADAPQASPATADRPASSTPPETPAVATTAERVYVLRADLGYATLQLDFLVYKPGGGFGRVNGQDVAPGTIVEGFTVEAIGPDFIRLRDSRGPLVLRTR